MPTGEGVSLAPRHTHRQIRWTASGSSGAPSQAQRPTSGQWPGAVGDALVPLCLLLSSVRTRCVDNEEEEAQLQWRSGLARAAAGHVGVGRPWVAWSVFVWTEAWTDGVRAGASVAATRGDATSVCVYICAGLRLLRLVLEQYSSRPFG